MGRPQIDFTAASFPVRDALKFALYHYHIAQETGNREVKANCREFIRKYYPQRNTDLRILNR